MPGGQRKKSTFFQLFTPTSLLPGHGETVAEGRQSSVEAGSVLMEEEVGTHPTTEGEGKE